MAPKAISTVGVIGRSIPAVVVDSTTCSKHNIREPAGGHGIEMRPVVFLGGMFGLLGYIIFGVFFVLSCVAKFMAFKHLGPKWIERFVLSNRSS